MTENSEKKPHHFKRGPHGLGDPDDRSLRKLEENISIPQIRREIVKTEKCAKIIEDYEKCVLETGLFMAPIKCKTLKLSLSDCLEYWNDDDEIIARAKKQYLDERSEYRRTGVCKENREAIFQYLKENRKQESQ